MSLVFYLQPHSFKCYCAADSPLRPDWSDPLLMSCMAGSSDDDWPLHVKSTHLTGEKKGIAYALFYMYLLWFERHYLCWSKWLSTIEKLSSSGILPTECLSEDMDVMCPWKSFSSAEIHPPFHLDLIFNQFIDYFNFCILYHHFFLISLPDFGLRGFLVASPPTQRQNPQASTQLAHCTLFLQMQFLNHCKYSCVRALF